MRDLPAALVAEKWQATVLTPAYAVFHKLPGSRKLATIDVRFRGRDNTATLYEVPGSDPSVRNLVVEHPEFSWQGPGNIYSLDTPERPFASDASKFAFFSAAAAAWINTAADKPDVVHLHDWHAATYLVLREFAPGFEPLRRIRTVFTIHNLSYQGMRPFSADESSLEAWFPELRYVHSALRDPHIAECYNPMAAAIRLADAISTVSPTYAGEICHPSNSETGFIGGEGLEGLLSAARDDGRLTGILNGCFYNGPKGRRPGWQRILGIAAEQLDDWQKAGPAHDAHAIAAERLAALPARRPKHVLTSIGRLVRQKAALWFENTSDGRPAIDAILEQLGSQGVLLMIGSGEPLYERQMVEVAKRHKNLVFICGYSDTLAEPLYRAGDLFLMPSSFEPCGISQMLAMRAAQPCVVHGVGGLRDTVIDMRDGFVFSGSTPREQADNFVASVARALEFKTASNDNWQKICIRAASARFSWAKSARATIGQLYAA